MQRIRLTYAKTEALRYTSNLDMQKVWERTLRRAQLALAYSQGFHPQPRLQQACPLPLGFLSQQEILDFWLESDCALETIQTAIQQAIPPGIQLINFETVPLDSPTLQKMVRSALYYVTLLDPHEFNDLNFRINALLESPALPRERRGKAYDLRPLIESITIDAASNESQPRLFMRTSAREGATGRPDEVLLALNLDPFAARIERMSLFIEQIIAA